MHALPRRDRQLFSPPPGTVLLGRPSMPRESLRVRAKTSPLLRTALPTPILLARARAKANRLWDARGETRGNALRAMQAVAEQTPMKGDVEELARRHMVENAAWNVLFWRRWPRNVPTEERCRERLLDATSQGRGIVLSGCHFGPHFMTSTMLVSLGLEPCVVSAPWFFEDPSPDEWGRRLAHWRREVPDLPRIQARGSYPTLLSLLEGGRSVLLYFDMPGRRETRFLGKPVWLVDGSARLAVEADAIVLPLRARREGRRVRLDIEEPLDPRAFSGPDELHDELARVHERLILEEPAAMHDPAAFGWGSDAGPLRWGRPRVREPQASR